MDFIKMFAYGVLTNAIDNIVYERAKPWRVWRKLSMPFESCVSMYTWDKWIWSTNCKFTQCKVELGMFTSLDHMHNCWKICLVSWQETNRNKNCSTISKAIWDQSFWIWHCSFGMPSDNIDISVLHKFLLVTRCKK
jgi:hypothetical protein